MQFGKPVNSNMVLRGDGKSSVDLEVFAYPCADGTTHMTSLWYPSERERLHILAGLPIQVHVIARNEAPALRVDVSRRTDAVTEGQEP